MKLFFFLLALLYLSNCTPTEKAKNLDYRQEMRNFVIEIGDYARNQDEDFIVIPQNGHEILLKESTENTVVAQQYLSAIDAIGQEDLFYGYEADDTPTPLESTEYITSLLDVAQEYNKPVLVTDYVKYPNLMDDAYSKNKQRNFISFSANSRELDRIPDHPVRLPNQNALNIRSINDVQNFLYLLNYQHFETKQELLSTLANTNYDLIIMDAFFHDEVLQPLDLEQIRTKKNGGERLLVSYMSIGESGDFRYYWDPTWDQNPPSWLDEENPYWEGNYKVRYWQKDWKRIIYGDESSYTQKIIDAGFDGVYLDIIDAFYYFETKVESSAD